MDFFQKQDTVLLQPILPQCRVFEESLYLQGHLLCQKKQKKILFLIRRYEMIQLPIFLDSPMSRRVGAD